MARHNRTAVPVAESKPDIPHALETAPQAVQVDKRFRVRVISIGRRLADPDNNAVKAVLDAITKVGIWHDDSGRFIEEISFTQKPGTEDQTVIEIYEVADE